MRIALFGGAFDPPHLGHVLCACWAWSMGGVDRIWILPAAKHPYAKPMSPWAQRWAMCQAAFTGLGFAELRDDELRNEPGYTVTLVELLRREHPDATFLLVGGTDTAWDLRRWHRGEELAGMVEVLAVPRRGYDDADPAALPAISSTLVREHLKRGEDVGRLMPRAVAELIARSGWYR